MSLSTRLVAVLLLLTACYTSPDTPPIVENEFEEEDKLNGYPADMFFLQRAFPERNFPYETYFDALETARVASFARSGQFAGFETEWTVQGPGNVGARINTAATHPSDEDIIYVGYSGGGVFKTTDGGANWEDIFSDKPYLSIGDIVLDPADPNTVYVGTGDPNVTGYPFIGDGIYKSTDGGQNWTNIGLQEQGIIAKIVIDPTDSDIIYAATMGIPMERNNDRGLYKTIDGGQNWSQVLFISDQAGIIDLLIDPSNPDVLYAAAWNRIRAATESFVSGPNGGIYKTINGGDDWTPLTNGLPSGTLGRVGLEMSGVDTDNIFALYVDPVEHQVQGIFKTTNAGDNWTEIPTGPSTGLSSNALGGFGWYFGKIRVDPSNDNRIYILGVAPWFTFTSGAGWSLLTASSTTAVHVDNHDLIFNHQNDIVLATDGGLYKRESGSTNFNDVENIPASQFYRVAYNPHQPDMYYGGAQDNGSLTGNEATINSWERLFGGDGFQMRFHPTDPNIMYAESQNGNIWRSTNGGDSFTSANSGITSSDRRHWDMQYIISPHDPNVLYTGTYRAYRSSTSNPSWSTISDDLTDGNIFGSPFHTITSMDESPLQEGLLYYGTTDGNVWRTENTGSSWDSLHADLPNRYVTSVKASPDDVDKVYVTHSGYRYNEYVPHVHYSSNRGETWTDISGDLPQIGVNDIIILPDYNGQVLVIATDAGVYGTLNGGTNWERLGNNMPIVSVYDLEWNEINNEVVAATFGRSIMSFPLDSVEMPTSGNLSMGGQILTEAGVGVQSVEVYYGSDLADNVESDIDGNFSVNNLSAGTNCDLLPKKDVNDRNGITTFDIIKIREHILTLDTLDSPYKFIAADVNLTGTISGLDIVELRRLALFLSDTVTADSWRFVKSDYVFSDPLDPLNEDFPEAHECSDLQANLSVDFVGIKVGDISGNANPANILGDADDRAEPVTLQFEDQQFARGEEVTLTLYVENEISIKGLQLLLQFDTDALDYLEIVGQQLPDFGSEHLGRSSITRGLIPLSWDRVEGASILEDQGMLQVQFVAKQAGRLSELVNLDETRLRSELYDLQDGIHPLQLQSLAEKPADLSLFPNPFREKTRFSVTAIQAESYQLEIFNASGQVIYRENRQLVSGLNHWELAAGQFAGNGLYFYHLSSPTKTYSGRLVLLK